MSKFIENRGMRIHLPSTVYKPREDSFLMIDEITPLFTKNTSFCEVGSGSGIISISLALQNSSMVLATDINFDAALITHQNASFNKCDHLLVVCTDLVASFREGGLPKFLLFNPPYLPEDPEIDDFTPRYEQLQLIGGKKGYEIIINFMQNRRNKNHIVFTIISSFSTNPIDFQQMNPEWNCYSVDSKNLGFETIWLMKLESKK